MFCVYYCSLCASFHLLTITISIRPLKYAVWIIYPPASRTVKKSKLIIFLRVLFKVRPTNSNDDFKWAVLSNKKTLHLKRIYSSSSASIGRKITSQHHIVITVDALKSNRKNCLSFVISVFYGIVVWRFSIQQFSRAFV